MPRVVLDGGTDDSYLRRELLGRAQVVRADAAEAGQLMGAQVSTVADASDAARGLLDDGPEIVALAVPGAGDLVVWRDGEVLLPLAGEVVDPTGAGDAFVVGLTAALCAGRLVPDAARVAAATSRYARRRLDTAVSALMGPRTDRPASAAWPSP